MTRSVYQMAELVTGLTDVDMSTWERSFVDTIRAKLEAFNAQKEAAKASRLGYGHKPPPFTAPFTLTDRQIEVLERLHNRHFA